MTSWQQHGNHLSGTWGDAEQESGGVYRKQFDFIFLWIFKICLYSNVNSICHDFGMKIWKNYKKKKYHCGTWEMHNKNLQKTILFHFFFMNFLKTKTFYKPFQVFYWKCNTLLIQLNNKIPLNKKCLYNVFFNHLIIIIQTVVSVWYAIRPQKKGLQRFRSFMAITTMQRHVDAQQNFRRKWRDRSSRSAADCSGETWV